MKIWVNGQLVEPEQAVVSVFDHGLLYGDGVFEGIRIYSGRIFRSAAHIDRLYDSARAIRLEIGLTKGQMAEALDQTVRANGVVDGYIRLVVTRGPGNLGLNPFQCQRPNVFIIAGQIQLYPKEMYELGMSTIIARTRRMHPSMLSPQVKSLNYLNNILARIEAVDAGAPEALMLNADGMVAEGTGDNVFMVRGGLVLTPPPEDGILVGVTRQLVIELCRTLGIPVAEKSIRPEELYAADECFLTGTAAEVIPITRVDGRAIGAGRPGPVTARLRAAFHDLIRSGRDS